MKVTPRDELKIDGAIIFQSACYCSLEIICLFVLCYCQSFSMLLLMNFKCTFFPFNIFFSLSILFFFFTQFLFNLFPVLYSFSYWRLLIFFLNNFLVLVQKKTKWVFYISICCISSSWWTILDFCFNVFVLLCILFCFYLHCFFAFLFLPQW